MIISKEFSGYNHRRYSRPWGAKITFPDNIKPVYSFDGYWSGDSRGSHGEVSIKAEVGDVLAFGQKDLRGNGTNKAFYVVEEGGTLREVDLIEARKQYNERATA